MMKAIFRLRANDIKEAELFYCKDLALFDFYQDYGMGTISLIARNNPGFILLLTPGTVTLTKDYLFELETANCDALFDILKQKVFISPGRLLSTAVFEYPLGKSIALQDPSGNKFLLFES